MIHILHSNVRPTHEPLAQRLFSLASSMWTSMASPPVIATSSGSIWSIGDPCICGVVLLGVWGGQLMAFSCKDNAGPCELSTPITVAIESIESDCGSLYASPSDPSTIASQSCGHCHLAPLPPLDQSVWLCLHSPPPAQAQCQWSVAWGATLCPPLMRRNWGNSLFGRPRAWLSGPPLLGCAAHSLPGPWQTSPQPR